MRKIGMDSWLSWESHVFKATSHHNMPNDGLVDTLRALLLCENYVKPWSNEYYLVKLLTRTF